MRQVEAKYPALLFKQQLTAFLEKIYGMIRDNLKKEISPLLGLCIQVLLTVNCMTNEQMKTAAQLVLTAGSWYRAGRNNAKLLLFSSHSGLSIATATRKRSTRS